MTPIHSAALWGHIHVIEKLLGHAQVEKNPKIDYGQWKGRTPIQLAKEKGHENIVELFENHNIFDKEENDFNDTENEEEDYYYDYYDFSIPIDIKDKLLDAVKKGDKTMVLECFNEDLNDYNPKDVEEKSAMHIAAEEGQCEILSIFLNHPKVIEKNPIDNQGRSPMHLAAYSGQVQAIVELLNHDDVIINMKDNYGRAPIHLAVYENQIKVVEKLLNHAQVEKNPKDDNGFTPLEIAIINEHDNIVAIFLAVLRYQLKVIEKLLGHNQFDTNTKDYMSPMHHFIAIWDQVQVIEKYVEKLTAPDPDVVLQRPSSFKSDKQMRLLKMLTCCCCSTADKDAIYEQTITTEMD